MIPSCFLYQITDGGKKEKGFSQRESLEIAKQAGIKNMDINAAMFDSVPVENVKALLDEFGMTMCVHSARICDFSSEEGYNKSLETMKKDLLTAKKGGSKYLMAVPLLSEEDMEKANSEYREYFFRIFKELADYGDKEGVCVTVENYSDTRLPYARIEDIKEILDKTPNLYYNLDTGNFTLAGEDALKGAECFLERTVNVHLKDVEESEKGTIVRMGKNFDCVALGEGIVDNLKIMQMLKSAGYKGYLTSEVTKPLFDRSVQSVKYIVDFIEKGE